MIAGDVISAAVLDPISPGTVGGAGGLELKHAQVRKGAGLPTEHVRFHFIERVPAGGTDEATDGVPGGSAVNLCRAADMKRRVTGRVFDRGAVDPAVNGAASDAESRVEGKFGEADLKITLGEGKIAVEFDEEIPLGS